VLLIAPDQNCSKRTDFSTSKLFLA